MSEKENKNTISQKILNEIKKRKVKMRPKCYFVLKTLFYILGAVLVLILAVFLVSFIIFVLRVSGAFFLPRFGFSGLRAFLAFLPWVLIFMAVLFILITEVFAKRFSIVYRKPLLYSVLGLLLIVLIAGYFVVKTPFHKNLFNYAQSHPLPLFGRMYRDYGMRRPPHITVGTVVKISENSLEIETEKGERLKVVLSDEIGLSAGQEAEVGDLIMIIGKRSNDSIQARGFRKIENIEKSYPNPRPFLPPMPPRRMQ